MLTETLDNLIRERRGNRSLRHYRYNSAYYASQLSLKGKRILDIGCGDGLLLATNAVLFEPSLAIGIDNYKGEGSPASPAGGTLSSPALGVNPVRSANTNSSGNSVPDGTSNGVNFIRKLQRGLNLPNLCFAVMDARDIAFKPESFDVIFASQFLHHLHIDRRPLRADPVRDRSSRPGRDDRKSEDPTPILTKDKTKETVSDEVSFISNGADNSIISLPVYRVIKDIYRLLARGGVLVVIEAPRYTAIRLAQRFGLLPDIDFATKQEPSAWLSLLKHCGFRDIKVKYHTPYPLRHLAPLLQTKLTRYLLSYQYYIFAYK